LKNVLIDKQVSWLGNDESKELLKGFDKPYVVGVDLKQSSFDENCASFCMDKNCDFLTADIGAYVHFFKIKKIKNVLISRFTRDKDPERYVYLMQIN